MSNFDHGSTNHCIDGSVLTTQDLLMKVHPSTPCSSRRRRPTNFQILGAIYHWATWLYIAFMACSQFLCIVHSTVTSSTLMLFGRNPLLGVSPIVGQNDAAYSDRVVVCVRGRSGYEPMTVNQVIASGQGYLIDSSGDYKGGYRVIERHKHAAIDSLAREVYRKSCDFIEKAAPNIVHACIALGYAKPSDDYMIIVIEDRTYLIPNSLPILTIPFYDSAIYGRWAMPTEENDACMFRFTGKMFGVGKSLYFRGVNRSVLHDRIATWLHRPGGQWRNGWYEDLTGGKWHGEGMTTFPDPKLGIMHRQFDMDTGFETDCSQTVQCNDQSSVLSTWSSTLTVRAKSTDVTSFYVGNASHCGLFIHHAKNLHVITAIYDWNMFLANVTVILLLFRWMMAMLALHHGRSRCETEWYNVSIGCTAGSRNMQYLPFGVLPRLKMILCAICTVGCDFEGQQNGMSDAWFVVYPAIVEFTLLYFSVLNVLGKICRRRISDSLFAPTIIVLALMHFFRNNLANSGWLEGVQGRVTTAVFSSEVDNLKLYDFVSTNVALRLNGNVRELFAVKLVLFGVNLLPLLFGQPLPVSKRSMGFCSIIEKAIAVDHRNVGGLDTPQWNFLNQRNRRGYFQVGPTSVSATPYANLMTQEHQKLQPGLYLSSYELVRLGYVVYGGKYVIKFDDWDLISSCAPLRSFFHLWNHRVIVWTLEDVSVNSVGCIMRRKLSSLTPKLLRLDDPLLQEVRLWHISACDVE